MICLHGDSADYAGGRRAHLSWVGGISLRVRALDDAQGAVADVYIARLPVQLEKERTRSVGVRLTGSQILNDKRFSGFDLDGDLFAGFQAVEKSGSGENTYVGVRLAKLVIFQEHFGIEKIAEQIVAANSVASFCFERGLFFLEFHRLHAGARAPAKRSRAAQNNFLELLR